jgi:hypothetical protein
MSKYCAVTEQQTQCYTCCRYAATTVSTSGLNSPSRAAVKRTLFTQNVQRFDLPVTDPQQAWLSSGGSSVESPELTRPSTLSACNTCLQPANGLGY